MVMDNTERYGITLRIKPELRNDIAAIGNLPIASGNGSVPLNTVADIVLRKGPAEIRSEGGRPVAYVYLDIGNTPVSQLLHRPTSNWPMCLYPQAQL
jgi:Cu/Ag efflux pump CusA